MVLHFIYSNGKIVDIRSDFKDAVVCLFSCTYLIDKNGQIDFDNFYPFPSEMRVNDQVYGYNNGKLECNGEEYEYSFPLYDSWYEKYQEFIKNFSIIIKLMTQYVKENLNQSDLLNKTIDHMEIKMQPVMKQEYIRQVLEHPNCKQALDNIIINLRKSVH